MILSLVITCLVSALALSQVYTATAPVIYRRTIEGVKRALTEVMPDADSFPPVPGNDSLWLAFRQGQRVGAVLRAGAGGYGGPVPVMAGIDLQGRITAIKIAGPAEGLKETQGLGTRVTDPSWRAQFALKTAGELRLDKNGGAIAAVSGATISSRAVTEGIRAAMEKYSKEIQP
jgi:electron transport complex protein RnfG